MSPTTAKEIRDTITTSCRAVRPETFPIPVAAAGWKPTRVARGAGGLMAGRSAHPRRNPAENEKLSREVAALRREVKMWKERAERAGWKE